MSTSLQSRIPKEARSLVELSIGYYGNLHCKCLICGYDWQLNIPGRGHKHHRGYWKCPNGCTQRALDEQQQTDE